MAFLQSRQCRRRTNVRKERSSEPAGGRLPATIIPYLDKNGIDFLKKTLFLQNVQGIVLFAIGRSQTAELFAAKKRYLSLHSTVSKIRSRGETDRQKMTGSDSSDPVIFCIVKPRVNRMVC